MAKDGPVGVPEIDHLHLRAAIQKPLHVSDQLSRQLRIGDAKRWWLSLPILQSKPVGVCGEIRLRHPRVHRVTAEDQMQSALLQLRHNSITPLVPRLRLAMGVWTFVDP